MNRATERLLNDVARSETIQRELLTLGWTRSELESLFPKASEKPQSNQLLESTEAVVVYTDGACRGNPGPSSAGWVIEDLNGAIIAQAGVFLGKGTNNEAEYSAAILGLEDAYQRGAKQVCLRADSELMIKQLNGTYRVKNERLKPLFEKLKEITKKFDRIQLEHVKRHLNQAADEQANLALDARR